MHFHARLILAALFAGSVLLLTACPAGTGLSPDSEPAPAAESVPESPAEIAPESPAEIAPDRPAGTEESQNDRTGSGTGEKEMFLLKQTDLIRAPGVCRPLYIRPEKGFEFEVEISSLGTSYDPEKVKSSIENLELGTYEPMRSPSGVYEWGYSFTHLDGQTDGAGEKIEAGYKTPPGSRAEALRVIESFLLRQYLGGGESPRPWISVNGHYMWHHYAGEFGFGILGSEVGENINSYQMHVAFNRGAAVQYGVPWAIDFSAWHGPGITDYSSGKIWGDYSGPDNGHSMSLLRRTYFMSYMAGAPYIVAEAGGAISFLDTTDDNGNYELSPYGHIGKEFYEFTRSNPDVGIAYVPFGIVLDYYHGVYPGFEEKRAFGFFEYNRGDAMTWEILDLFFPGGWETMGRKEEGTLVNGPYGDTCDVLLQNASAEVLGSYPALILSGDIAFSAEEVRRYENYAAEGGTLVLNSAYLDFFPDYRREFTGMDSYEIAAGKGRVIVYGSGYSTAALDGIIRGLLAELLPFRVSPDIAHVVTVKDGSLFIALFNNDGVTKDFHTPPETDASKRITAEVAYTGELDIKRVKDLISKTDAEFSGNAVEIVVEPGEIAVFEFVFG